MGGTAVSHRNGWPGPPECPFLSTGAQAQQRRGERPVCGRESSYWGVVFFFFFKKKSFAAVSSFHVIPVWL